MTGTAHTQGPAKPPAVLSCQPYLTLQQHRSGMPAWHATQRIEWVGKVCKYPLGLLRGLSNTQSMTRQQQGVSTGWSAGWRAQSMACQHQGVAIGLSAGWSGRP